MAKYKATGDIKNKEVYLKIFHSLRKNIEVEKIRSGEQISREKIGSQEQIADDKIDVALEKLDQQADFKESDIRRGK